MRNIVNICKLEKSKIEKFEHVCQVYVIHTIRQP
jgi:hypothetical protein